MNKRPNPFHQSSLQPPPPPSQGYPPPPPGGQPPGNHQQEWAAYWASQQAAGASYQQPSAPQWPQQPPPAPPQQAAYDPALYRNYGYGGQNKQLSTGWHQPQHPQPPAYPAYPQQYPTAYSAYPPQPPVAAPPPPVPYNPQYPYPTPPPMPMAAPPPRHNRPPPPPGPPQQPPHHQPPAKRPRFDSNANGNRSHGSSLPPAPIQPPPLHFKPGGGMVPASQMNSPTNSTKFPLPNGSGHNRGGGHQGGHGRGGGGVGRGGGRGGGQGMGGRSGRGGGQGGMGRGGGTGGRGGFSGHGRQGPRGPASFRQNQPSNRFQGSSRPRQSTATSEASSNAGSASNHGLPTSTFNFTPANTSRGASPFTGTGKRTLTDFRIVSFGVRLDDEDHREPGSFTDLDWIWGGNTAYESPNVKSEAQSPQLIRTTSSNQGNSNQPIDVSQAEKAPISPSTSLRSLKLDSTNADHLSAAADSSRHAAFKLSSTNSIPITPRHAQRGKPTDGKTETSRIRIYFQCPVEMEDPVTTIKGRIWSVPGVDSGVGGKRKKYEDEEEEDGGGKRPREDLNPNSSAYAPSQANEQENGNQLDTSGESETLGGASNTEVSQQGTGNVDIAEPSLAVDESDVDAALADATSDGAEQTAYFDAEADAEGEDDGTNYFEGDGDGDGEGEDAWHHDMSWAAEEQGVPLSGDSEYHPLGESSSAEHPQTPTASGNVPEGQAGDSMSMSPVVDSTSPHESVASTLAPNADGLPSPMHGPLPTANAESNAQANTSAMRTPLKEVDGAPREDLQRSLSHEPTLPSPSPNRISISYAGSARRLVIDADVIESMKIRRAEGRIDVVLLLERRSAPSSTLSPIKEEGDSALDDPGHSVTKPSDEMASATAATVNVGEPAIDDAAVLDRTPASAITQSHSLRGILIDALDEKSQAYHPIALSTFESDSTIPPFLKYVEEGHGHPTRVRMALSLDKEKPLSEPKWVKTGDIEDWLKALFGPVKSESQQVASWSGKIIIADPDPPPTVYTIVDNWASQSVTGPPKERRRFANDFVKVNFDYIVEILLRSIRRESTANGFPSGGQPSGTSLMSALTPDFPNAPQQNHLSLAVLSLYRMSAEYAAQAGVDAKVVEGRFGQFIRALPQSTVFKSLDGMFKDWQASQKKANGSKN